MVGFSGSSLQQNTNGQEPPAGNLNLPEAVRLIPLPNEIPSALHLDHLPSAILHSATVEALINQNEDLMARLKISLRRASLIENKVLDLEKHLTDAKHAFTAQQSQIQIYQEKDRLWKEKQSKLSARVEMLTTELELEKLRNSELGKANREKHDRALDAEQRLGRLKRRISRWVKPGIETRQSQVKELQLQLKQLGRALQEKQSILFDVTNRSEEMASRLRTADQDLTTKLAKISQKYEDKLNQFISHIRELEGMVEQSQSQLQQQITNDHESKDLMTSQERELNNLRQQTERLQMQLDQTHRLWSESNSRREAAEGKTDSLLRLNQELGRQLLALRTNQTLDHASEAPVLLQPMSVPPIDAKESVVEQKILGFSSGFIDPNNEIDRLLRELESSLQVQTRHDRNTLHTTDFIQDSPGK